MYVNIYCEALRTCHVLTSVMANCSEIMRKMLRRPAAPSCPVRYCTAMCRARSSSHVTAGPSASTHGIKVCLREENKGRMER